MNKPQPNCQIKVLLIENRTLSICTSTVEAFEWVESELNSFGWISWINLGSVIKGLDEFVLLVNSCFNVEEVRQYIDGMDGKLPEKG